VGAASHGFNNAVLQVKVVNLGVELSSSLRMESCCPLLIKTNTSMLKTPKSKRPCKLRLFSNNVS
jgi:hypothetical protein